MLNSMLSCWNFEIILGKISKLNLKFGEKWSKNILSC